MSDVVLAITGHRPQKLGGYAPCSLHTRVRAAIRSYFAQHHPARVITGMALGVDQWAAEAALELGVPFTAAVPFQGQEKLWPAPAQARYAQLLTAAAEVVVVSPGGYQPAKMHHRNEWMVDHATALLAVWDGTPGGTGSCVAYAQRVGRRIARIDPTTLR